MRILWLAVCTLSLGSPAMAAWHEASSTHFVIYSQQGPERLREFATKLEKFDSAVRFARSMSRVPPGPGNRLTVYVVSGTDQVDKLHRGKDSNVAGFYIGRASGSIAVVPRDTGSRTDFDLDAETVFFHEYAHHLMMQELNQPYPEWMVEGFAEFMSTARFDKDGSVGLGVPAVHRARSLFSAWQLPLEKMFAGQFDKLGPELRLSAYARGWLLTHYLTFETSRRGQLEAYLQRVAKGEDSVKAAEAAFGSFKELDDELRKYVKRPRFSYFPIPASELKVGSIDVRGVSEGTAAILPLRMESDRGVNRKTAGPLAQKFRTVAARFPDDAFVQAALAEAEYDARDLDAAEAAADRALGADPKNVEAMIYKGRITMVRAGRSRDVKEWGKARDLFLAANKIDVEDPEPLMLFYQSFLRQGIAPTRNAIAAIHYASDLAPQDIGLRMTSGMQYVRDGKLDRARLQIAAVAYNPHGGRARDAAKLVMDLIAKGDGEAALAAGRSDPEADED